MNFGVVVTKEGHSEAALGLLEAAALRGWQLRCFLTDSGVKLFQNPRFVKLCRDGHWLALCEMSLERYHISIDDVKSTTPDIIIGGQYQDAELVKNSDQIIVL